MCATTKDIHWAPVGCGWALQATTCERTIANLEIERRGESCHSWDSSASAPTIVFLANAQQQQKKNKKQKQAEDTSVGVLASFSLFTAFCLPWRTLGISLWSLLPTLLNIRTAACLPRCYCSTHTHTHTRLSDVLMNTYSNRYEKRRARILLHSVTLPCCFVPKNIGKTRKLSLFTGAWLSHIGWCQGTFFFPRCVQRFSCDWFCEAETRQQSEVQVERMWKGMRYVREAGVRVWEYLSEETWERPSWKGRETVECIWDMETTQPTEAEHQRTGSESYTVQRLPEPDPLQNSHLGWLIMMSYSVRCWDLAPHLYPFRKASPLETGISPVSILNVVVFPAPLIPSNPKH